MIFIVCIIVFVTKVCHAKLMTHMCGTRHFINFNCPWTFSDASLVHFVTQITFQCQHLGQYSIDRLRIRTMKTKRIDNFLYCFQLETGGLFLGWFGIVGSIFATLICILMIVGLSQFFTDENLQQMGFGDSGTIDNDRMSVIRTGEILDWIIKITSLKPKSIFLVLLICFSLGIFYAIVNFVISIYLIRGTKNVR